MESLSAQAAWPGHLLELVNEVVWTAALDGQLLFVNSAIERIHGRPVADFYNNPDLWLEMVHPDDRQIARQSADQLLALGQTEATYRIVRPDGHIRWLLDRKHVVFDQAGQPQHIGGIITDITAQKQVEIDLARSQQLLDAFFTQALDGIFFMMLDEPVEWHNAVDKEAVLDYVFAHQRITRANPAMLAQYKTTLEQFIGQTPNDFFAHNLPEGRAVWRQFFDQGRLHLETDERRFDGTIMTVEGDYVCLYDPHGRIMGHFGIQRDVTDRQKAALALRESEKKYRFLFDNSGDAILLTAPDGGVLAANPAACRMFGRTEAEICRLGRAGLVDPTDPRLSAGLQKRERTGSVQVELNFMHADGHLFPAELTSVIYLDANNTPKTSMIIRDISERKRMEEALRQSEGKFRSIVEHSVDAIVLSDETGRVIEWNQAAEQLTGQKRTGVLGQMIWDVQFAVLPAARQTPAMYEKVKSDSLAYFQTGQHPLLNELVEVEIQGLAGSPLVIQPLGFSIKTERGFLLGSIIRDVTQSKLAEAEMERLIAELQQTLAQVKQLSGMLPICANCKNIRDDRGYWQQVEVYIRDHSEANFSHGICPDCMKKLYPDLYHLLPPEE
ncbi:MAG: hypothetical protein FOGNACKC_00487 [Anaerolineae bacterium]|nr:hypothetical protein [Anaerolineae bacterium]